MTRRRFILNAAGVLVPFAGPVVKAQYLPHRRKAFRGGGGSGPFSGLVSTENLVSHWKLDEESGTRLDSHGSNHLSDNNTVTSVAGKLGNAAEFVAVNAERLSIDDNADLSLGADSAFSVVCWAYCIEDGSISYDRALAGHGKTMPGGTGMAWALDYTASATNRRLQFNVSNGTASALAEIQSNPLGDEGWHLIIGWHDPDADKVCIQIDNGTPDETDWSGGTMDATTGFCIGRWGTQSAYRWNGGIDSFSFFKRVLTSGERSALWNSGNGLDY